MRIVRLSDHPGAMLARQRQRRAAADQDVQLAYQEALARYGDRLAEARRVRDQARAEHRWGAWLRHAVTAWRLRRGVPPAPSPASGPSDEEEILAAGIEGEQLVETRLGRALDEEWTLLRGYRNRGGEIDHLVLGPRGLFAIEVKHRNATVECAGDRWRYTKYDQYGNAVEHGELADRGGRSPSQQLNQPADQLADFLRSRGRPVAIERIVALTHPRSRLGRCTGPTLHIATSVEQILSLLNGPSVALTPDDRAQLEQLIIRDHRFQAARRQRR